MNIVEHAYRPSGRSTMADLAEQIPALAALVHRDHSRPDVLVVRTGSGRSDDELRELGRSLSTAVGRLLPQDAGKSTERDVFHRVGAAGPTPARYSASSGATPMHTDGMHVPDQAVPRYFSLTCIHQAASGGELAFVHLNAVLDRLVRSGVNDGAIGVLSQEFWFHTKGVDPKGRLSVRRRVLATGLEGPEIHYAREYIDLGHALPEAPDLDEEQLVALGHLDEILADRSLWHEHRLARGDVALIDNRRTLHARSAFVNDPAQPARRMMRLWIDQGAGG